MKTTIRKAFCELNEGRLSKTMNGLVATAFSLILVMPANNAGATAIVDLGTAGDYAILSKSGISTTAGTTIIGDIGVSPIAATAITGFSLTLDPSGQFSTSPLIAGQVFAADYSAPTPSALGVAVGDMQAAYTDAAGRSSPDYLNLLGGNLDGQILSEGLYKWTSAVSITNSVTINGGGDPNAVWIFQIDNRLTLTTGANIILSNGAQARNIFWQTAEGATLGANSHFEGILLTATDIAAQTGATLTGNLYAQTAVTLQSNAITQAIPEPTTWALLGIGLGAVALVNRKRRGLTK